MKPTRRLLICLLISLMCSSAFACISKPSSFSVSYGLGRFGNVQGGRFAVQWPWERLWFADKAVNLTGYWDLSIAHWHADPDEMGRYQDITSFAIAPIFRVHVNKDLWPTFSPYLEGSVGATVHTARFLGPRNLGSYFAFQDLLGLGVEMGTHRQYDLSFHFLHYSNAGLAPPNSGITIEYLMTLKYQFG